MNARFDMSRILAPASILPRTDGPRDSVITHHMDDEGTRHVATVAQPTGDTTMANGTTAIVLAAIQKQSPISRNALGKACSNLTSDQLSNAVYNLKTAGKIVRSGFNFGVPGTKFETQVKSAAAPTAKPSKINKPPAVPTKKSAPVKVPPRVATITPAPDAARAIRTFDGGVIVLRGNLVIVELTAAQADAIRSL